MIPFIQLHRATARIPFKINDRSFKVFHGYCGKHSTYHTLAVILELIVLLGFGAGHGERVFPSSWIKKFQTRGSGCLNCSSRSLSEEAMVGVGVYESVETRTVEVVS